MRPANPVSIPVKTFLPAPPSEIFLNVCHDEPVTSSYDYTDMRMRQGEKGLLRELIDSGHIFCGCEDYPCCGH